MAETLYFDFAQLFDAEEYLYFMEASLALENTERQVDFLEAELAMTPGMSVLDLGCGHGRHAIELAKRGYPVTGVDLTEGFLEVARKRAEEAGQKVEFLRGDMGAFVKEEAFDRAICLFDAFGFFDDPHGITTLENVHKSLKSGGRFCLDIRTREWMTRMAPASVTSMPNGDKMIDEHQFDIVSGRFIDRRTYLRGGIQREVMFSVRLYAFTEIRLILQSVGFSVTHVFGGFERVPLSAQSPRTVIICEKP